MTRIKRWELLLILLLIAAAAAFWLSRILPAGKEPSLARSSDLLTYYMPLTDYAATELRRGNVPLWNPYEMAGLPLTATMQFGGWYPPNLLYLIMSPGTAWFLAGLLHSALAGVCMFAFCRALKIGIFGAAVAALIFMFCSWTVVRAEFFPDELRATALMPLVFLCAEGVVRRRSFVRVFCLGVVLSLLMLSGEVEIFVRTSMILGPYILCRLAAQPATGNSRWRSACATVAAIAAAYLICLGLTAIQWVPTRELVNLSTRPPGAMPPEYVWFPAPSFAVQVLNLLGAMKTTGLFRSASIGLVGLILLLFSPLCFRRRPIAIFFVAVAVLGFLLSLGTATFLASVYYHLPTGSWFRLPSRLLVFFAFAAPVSVAFAADYVTGLSLERPRSAMRASACAGVVLVAVSLVYLMRGETVGAIAAHDTGWTPAVRNIPEHGLWAGQIVVLISALSLCALLVSKRAGVRYAAQTLLCLLIIFDTWRAVATTEALPHHHYPRAVKGEPGIVEFVRENAGTYRTYFEFKRFGQARGTPTIGLMNGIFALNGRDPLCPARFADFVEPITPLPESAQAREYRAAVPSMGNVMFSGNSNHIRLLDYLAVKYIVVGPKAGFFRVGDGTGEIETRIDTARYKLVHETGSTKTYENLEALPRVYVASDYDVIGNPATILGELIRPGFEPRETVIFEKQPDFVVKPGDGGSGGTATIREYEPERVAIDVRTAAGGFVVLSDLFFPGWKALLDGAEAPIYRANFMFRAVPVPSGDHEVTFLYRPLSFRLGAAISVSTLAILLALGLATRHFRGSRGRP